MRHADPEGGLLHRPLRREATPDDRMLSERRLGDSGRPDPACRGGSDRLHLLGGQLLPELDWVLRHGRRLS
jgi:hypothetical protein